MTSVRRLLIDASAAANQGAGIGRYSRELLSAALPHLAQDYELTIWYAQAGKSSPFLPELLSSLPISMHRQVKRSLLSRRRVDQLARLPIDIPGRLLGARGDFAYSPDFTLPGSMTVPSMVTVHDLAFERIPEAYPPGLLAYLQHVVPVNVRRSTKVAVVSRTTRIDVVERYNLPSDRVVVIPNAADSRFFSAIPLNQDRRAELGIPDDYVLAVGTIEPRKNYLNLLSSQRAAYTSTKRPLVVVGRSGWQNRDEMRLLGELAEQKIVVPLLDALDSDLPGLYAGATSVIYVPLYEGFGLPVLEAMASGAPVITSDIPSVKEVAAGFATIVNPNDQEQIAEALVAVGSDTVENIRKRRDAAARYSWVESGTILVDTLNRLAG